MKRVIDTDTILALTAVLSILLVVGPAFAHIPDTCGLSSDALKKLTTSYLNTKALYLMIEGGGVGTEHIVEQLHKFWASMGEYLDCIEQEK